MPKWKTRNGEDTIQVIIHYASWSKLPIWQFVLWVHGHEILFSGALIGPAISSAILHDNDNNTSVYNSSYTSALWSKCGTRDCPGNQLNETAIEPQDPQKVRLKAVIKRMSYSCLAQGFRKTFVTHDWLELRWNSIAQSVCQQA